MDGWAIDSYGLRAAHSQSILDRVRCTDRLHVSPLTWHPGTSAGTGGKFKGSLATAAASGIPGNLTLVDSGVSRTYNCAVALGTRLRELHDQGVLVLAGEHECDPQVVIEVEGSWKQAGLVWRPTNETFSAVMTADRLGVDLITDDSDVRKLARHWEVQPMTVAEFASVLAA
jgi:hypothetical protein